MPGKPRKNKQISVNYKTHQKLESEAIENDKTIKEVAEEYIYNDNEEEINKLHNQIDKLKDIVRGLRGRKHDLSKKLENQSGGEWENYEEVSRENFAEAMKEKISGVGEKKASKFLDVLSDEVKIIAPKDM